MIKLNNLHPQYITNEKGEKQSVIIPISDFEELIEDIEDLAAIAERKSEPAVSHENFLADLRDNGLL